MQKYGSSTFPSVVDDLIYFADESLMTHEDIETYRGYLQNGDYTGAKNFLDTVANADYYGADLFNMIEERIYNTQLFVSGREKLSPIVYSSTEPSTMQEYQKVWIDVNLSTS